MSHIYQEWVNGFKGPKDFTPPAETAIKQVLAYYSKAFGGVRSSPTRRLVSCFGLAQKIQGWMIFPTKVTHLNLSTQIASWVRRGARPNWQTHRPFDSASA
jgi:hypothetical protein